MNAEVCECNKCYTCTQRINLKRRRTPNQESQTSDSEECEFSDYKSPKKIKSFSYGNFYSLVPFVTSTESPTRPRNSPSNRKKRMINKVIAKESISCGEFQERFQEILKSKSNQNAYQISQRIIRLIQFSFPLELDILGKSFLKNTDKNIFRLDLPGLKDLFLKIDSLSFDDTLNAFVDRFRQIISTLCKSIKKCKTKNSVKICRVIAIFFESSAFSKMCTAEETNRECLDSLFTFVSSLRPTTLCKFVTHFASFDKGRLDHLVSVLQQYISSKILAVIQERDFLQTIASSLNILSLIQRANSTCRLLSQSQFQNASVGEALLLHYNVDNISTKCPVISKHAWILDLSTKKELFRIENRNKQFKAVEKSLLRRLTEVERSTVSPQRLNANERIPLRLLNDSDFIRVDLRNVFSETNAFGDIPVGSSATSPRRSPRLIAQDNSEQSDTTERRALTGSIPELELASLGEEYYRNSGFCYFMVCREHLGADTYRFVQAYNKENLAKPIKVIFNREDGVDEGGLTNEFFELLTKEIFSEEYRLFRNISESNVLWLNDDWSSHSHFGYEFCGMIIGLALYNNVVLDVNFPSAIYKHLIGQKPDYSDLVEINPELAKGLKALLLFEGDVESTFSRNFEISYESNGEIKTVELVKNGSKIPVNNQNRKKFVQLYISWALYSSVKRQVTFLLHGFKRIFSSKCQWIYNLLNANDLKLLLAGRAELDFKEWRSRTILNGYNWTDPVIRNLWRLLESFDWKQKRTFVFFVTGCVRAPFKGLSELPLFIVKGGSTDLLPTSRTCFNQFVLPPYETKAKLRSKLLLALKYAEGFGMQ